MTEVDAFRAHVSEEAFPCIGGKAAFSAGTCEARGYGALSSDRALDRLATDLRAFVGRYRDVSRFAVHAAIDPVTTPADEVAFERYLWQVLQRLHERDVDPWDPACSSDPRDPTFRFSFAGRAFFVIGMWPGASRLARRTPHTTLVFNPMWQFDVLARQRVLEPIRYRIRVRDVALQGYLNPNLRYEGTLTDARQYAGRAVEPDWRAPFRPRPRRLRLQADPP